MLLTVGSGRALLRPSTPRVATYADFQAYMATQAVDGSVDWDNPAPFATIGTYRSTARTPTVNTMAGSPWLLVFRFNNHATNRVAQHGLPSEAVYLDQIANGREMLFEVQDAGSLSTSSLDRNGYLSQSGGAATARRCVRLEYWDNGPKRMNPLAGSGPVSFTLPGF